MPLLSFGAEFLYQVEAQPYVIIKSNFVCESVFVMGMCNSFLNFPLLAVEKLPIFWALISVPYKRKKVRKVRNFFRHFRTEILRIPAFFLPPKTGVFVSRQKQLTAAVHGASLWYVAEIAEKSWRTQTKDLFFVFVLEINIKSEKTMPPSA